MTEYSLRPSGSISNEFIYKHQGSILLQEVDLRSFDSPVKNQQNLGSCVPISIVSAYELLVNKTIPDHSVELSPLFLYYNSRIIEETVKQDSGVMHIKTALKVSKLCGLSRESLWKYEENQIFNVPDDQAYIDALSRRIPSYKIIVSVDSILERLSNGFPVIIGMDVFEEFDSISKQDPNIKVPWRGAYSVGGHSVLVVGYSIPKQQFIIKNSFGTDWGDNGYAYVPFDYVKNYVFEAWSIDI